MYFQPSLLVFSELYSFIPYVCLQFVMNVLNCTLHKLSLCPLLPNKFSKTDWQRSSTGKLAKVSAGGCRYNQPGDAVTIDFAFLFTTRVMSDKSMNKISSVIDEKIGLAFSFNSVRQMEGQEFLLTHQVLSDLTPREKTESGFNMWMYKKRTGPDSIQCNINLQWVLVHVCVMKQRMTPN